MTNSWRKTAAFTMVIALCGVALAGTASAVRLPKGDCPAPKPFTDLQHCNFNGANLRNKDLRGVNLRNIDLRSPYRAGTELKGADLRGVNLQGADLREVNLQKADLRGADLRRADLREASVVWANLEGANLTDALVDGKGITLASLDGVIGLPPEALEIRKTVYLVKERAGGELVLSVRPPDYQGDGQSAGLDDLFLAYKVPSTTSTIALLSYPYNGDASTLIFARFEQGRFGFPACYRYIELFKENEPSYWGHWHDMQVRPLKTGRYLVGARAGGADANDAWSKVVIVSISPTCQVTRLYEEYSSQWAEDVILDETTGHADRGALCGGRLEYRLLNDRTAEIVTTIEASTEKECGKKASPQRQILRKKIPLKVPQ